MIWKTSERPTLSHSKDLTKSNQSKMYWIHFPKTRIKLMIVVYIRNIPICVYIRGLFKVLLYIGIVKYILYKTIELTSNVLIEFEHDS